MRNFTPAIIPAAIVASALTMVSAPAAAWSGTQIPEPSNLALFGLGLAGLIVGRQIAKNKRSSGED